MANDKDFTVEKAWRVAADAGRSCAGYRIRPNTINELYHELADRVNLEHLDLICEALDCELDELIVRIPNRESNITHTRRGNQKTQEKCRCNDTSKK